MSKYSSKAQDKVGEVMEEYKKGTLKSSSGDKVTNRKQAIAIGLSEARQKGYKAPAKKNLSFQEEFFFGEIFFVEKIQVTVISDAKEHVS